MEQFVTIENLSTMSGLILVVILLVQNFKDIVDNIFTKVFDRTLSTKYLVFVISQVLLFLSKYFLGTDFHNGEEIFITLINGCILSGVSYKSVETLMNKNGKSDSGEISEVIKSEVEKAKSDKNNVLKI